MNCFHSILFSAWLRAALMSSPIIYITISHHRAVDQPIDLLPSTVSNRTSLSKLLGCARNMWGFGEPHSAGGEFGFNFELKKSNHLKCNVFYYYVSYVSFKPVKDLVIDFNWCFCILDPYSRYLETYMSIKRKFHYINYIWCFREYNPVF